MASGIGGWSTRTAVAADLITTVDRHCSALGTRELENVANLMSGSRMLEFPLL
jgi:hypothetical protein